MVGFESKHEVELIGEILVFNCTIDKESAIFLLVVVVLNLSHAEIDGP